MAINNITEIFLFDIFNVFSLFNEIIMERDFINIVI